MKFSEAYQPGRLSLSFELFPPKTPAGEAALLRHVEQLMSQRPSFVTCTYGAGGSTRHKTLDVVEEVHRRFGVTVAAHLTCVQSSVEELCGYLSEALRRGIENIVALRGDPPRGEEGFQPAADGLAHANELVALIRDEFPQFGIAVAGYPETHQEATSPDVDLEHLKQKVDAGGDVVITQLFYDNADFFRFRDRCRRIGIAAPIVPGVLPVTDLKQIQRISSLCGARLPQNFVEDLQRHEGDSAGQFDVGVAFAAAQVQELIDAEVPGVHFYVLNKSQATLRILEQVRRPA